MQSFQPWKDKELAHAVAVPLGPKTVDGKWYRLALGSEGHAAEVSLNALRVLDLTEPNNFLPLAQAARAFLTSQIAKSLEDLSGLEASIADAEYAKASGDATVVLAGDVEAFHLLALINRNAFDGAIVAESPFDEVHPRRLCLFGT